MKLVKVSIVMAVEDVNMYGAVYEFESDLGRLEDTLGSRINHTSITSSASDHVERPFRIIDMITKYIDVSAAHD